MRKVCWHWFANSRTQRDTADWSRQLFLNIGGGNVSIQYAKAINLDPAPVFFNLCKSHNQIVSHLTGGLHVICIVLPAKGGLSGDSTSLNMKRMPPHTSPGSSCSATKTSYQLLHLLQHRFWTFLVWKTGAFGCKHWPRDQTTASFSRTSLLKRQNSQLDYYQDELLVDNHRLWHVGTEPRFSRLLTLGWWLLAQ